MAKYVVTGRQPPSEKTLKRRNEAIERYLNYCEALDIPYGHGAKWIGVATPTMRGYTQRRQAPIGPRVVALELVCTHLKHLYDNKTIPVDPKGIGRRIARRMTLRIIDEYLLKIGFYNPNKRSKRVAPANFIAKSKRKHQQKATNIQETNLGIGGG